MHALKLIAEFLAWCFAIWLFVGLVGALRWLAPGAEAGPDAFLAVLLRLIGLAVFVGGWALMARRVDRTEQRDGALT
jgi:hypothetical protein